MKLKVTEPDLQQTPLRGLEVGAMFLFDGTPYIRVMMPNVSSWAVIDEERAVRCDCYWVLNLDTGFIGSIHCNKLIEVPPSATLDIQR